MPLCVQAQLHKPSASMRQRFCSVAQESSSSVRQWILNPPVHFSNSTLQRGTTHQLPAAGAAAGKPEGCQAGAGLLPACEPTEKRSINTALDMQDSFQIARPAQHGLQNKKQRQS